VQSAADSAVPFGFARAVPKIDSVPAVIVIRFEDELITMFSDVPDQVYLMTTVKGLSLRHSASPGHAVTDDVQLSRIEPTAMRFVGQNLEAGFLLQQLASERVDQTDIAVLVGPDQRMRVVIAV